MSSLKIIWAARVARTDEEELRLQREQDAAFQRALALAYQRGEFPRECYPESAA